MSKWHVLEAFESKSLDPLKLVKAEAARNSDWANMRDIDQFSLRVSFDEELFNHLVFGTPFKALRRRILLDLDHAPKKDFYIWGKENSPCLNVLDGTIDGRVTQKPGGKCHHLIEVLLRDFYRPLKMGELFAEIFPDDHFDIFSSPNRLHQILFRTREWLNEENIPLEIVENCKISLQVQRRFLRARPAGTSSGRWLPPDARKISRSFSTQAKNFNPKKRVANWAFRASPFLDLPRGRAKTDILKNQANTTQ